MDELRSLEGMSRLMQNNKSDKPSITRAVSLMPTKIERSPLQIIQSFEDLPEMSMRSYSSRGQAVPSEFKEEEATNSANQPQMGPSPMNLSLPLVAETAASRHSSSNKKNNATPNDPSNANLLCINEILASENEEDDVDNEGFHLLSQLSARSAFSDFGSGDLGLGGLNMDLVDNVNDNDDDNDWYNDQILAEEINISFSPQANDYEEKQLQVVITSDEQQQKTIKDIASFPMEEFKDYPPTNATSNNKDIASDVYVIGSGSFGIVIKSFHLLSCETVAIKQCRISSDDKLLALFISEAEYYKMFIDSPYIINMLGFGRHEENSRLCIALEYMDLHSITQIDYDLNELQLSYIAYALLSALDTMHNMNCIHNDVKPDNILISSRGDVKLTDFGCCVKINSAHMTDNICGSKQYYAPEKWLVSPPKYNTLSDIWSFGITFYEIITLTMNSVREFGYSESPKLKHDNEILCDFVDKTVIWNASERWNASKLLKHPYLTENKTKKIEKVPFAKDNQVAKKESDLSFMVSALIEHYSNEHFFDNKEAKSPKQYTDRQKIRNLCKHSGCSEKEVNVVIRFAVDKAKSKIQKNTTH